MAKLPKNFKSFVKKGAEGSPIEEKSESAAEMRAEKKNPFAEMAEKKKKKK
jgi:hypothetical protein